MKKLTILLVPALLVAVVVCGLFHGCEMADSEGVHISPTSIGLMKDQFADFTASGGYEYTWSISNSEWGVLSAVNGETVRYTSRYEPTGGVALVQVITVVSTLPQSTSNFPDYSMTAQAFVEHLPRPVEEPPQEGLGISPGSAELFPYDAASFTASGGNGDYSWWIQHPEWGRLTASAGSNVTYTSTYDPVPGTNTASSVLQVLYLSSDGVTISANISLKD